MSSSKNLKNNTQWSSKANICQKAAPLGRAEPTSQKMIPQKSPTWERTMENVWIRNNPRNINHHLFKIRFAKTTNWIRCSSEAKISWKLSILQCRTPCTWAWSNLKLIIPSATLLSICHRSSLRWLSSFPNLRKSLILLRLSRKQLRNSIHSLPLPQIIPNSSTWSQNRKDRHWSKE